MKTYFLMDKEGSGLHYIQGKLWWNKPDSVEQIVDFTPFDSKKKAEAFAKDRNVPYHCIGVIKYTIGIAK